MQKLLRQIDNENRIVDCLYQTYDWALFLLRHLRSTKSLVHRSYIERFFQFKTEVIDFFSENFDQHQCATLMFNECGSVTAWYKQWICQHMWRCSRCECVFGETIYMSSLQEIEPFHIIITYAVDGVIVQFLRLLLLLAYICILYSFHKVFAVPPCYSHDKYLTYIIILFLSFCSDGLEDLEEENEEQEYIDNTNRSSVHSQTHIAQKDTFCRH